MTGKPYEPIHRQRYCFRRGVSRDQFVIWADWLEESGVYEGAVDPSSRNHRNLRIRLLHPTDPDLSYLVTEAYLEEVD